MKNEKLKLCPVDSCLTASGGVLALPPPVVEHIARRAPSHHSNMPTFHHSRCERSEPKSFTYSSRYGIY
jgi:hypothetical protein